jgi:putative endonuclease
MLSMNDQRKQLGTYGERLVEKRYIQAGYILLDRNFRCRFGEIDLIFQKGDHLYFVEVRTKSSFAYGTAEESVNWRKQSTIHKVSQYYMLQKKINTPHIHYDLVAVYIDKQTKKALMKRYPSAF